MPRIKITDLPSDLIISKEEMKSIMGGINFQSDISEDSAYLMQPVTFLHDIPMNAIQNINLK